MKILRQKSSKNKEKLLLVETSVSNTTANFGHGSYAKLTILIMKKDKEFRRVNQREVFVFDKKIYRKSESKKLIKAEYIESSRYKSSSEYKTLEEMNELFDKIWIDINVKNLIKRG